MGGKAIKNIKSLNQSDLKPTYEWVEKNILPLIGINKNEALPIGSFGKKPIHEKSGDIDIAFNANKFINEGIKFENVAQSLQFILEDAGFETNLLKGFDQISVKVPIRGNEKYGYAQVDLMPSVNLKWAQFMYHSPNLKEEESKYKGAVRNALLMSIISESTKLTTKLFEGKAEEYEALAVRFPTGVWNIKRSFMGKKGNLINKGTVLESELITSNPQDVIDIALGEGFKVGAANSFETLWEIIHRKGYIHKNKLNEIMSKFKVNLKSMYQDVPIEAVSKYPQIFENLLFHTGDPFDPIGLYKNPSNIKRFAPYVKCLIDIDGNMYIEDIPGDWLHSEMAEILKQKGFIYFNGSFYDNAFVTMMRIDSSDSFGLTEGTEKTFAVIETLNKAQKKNPQYKFYAKHYEEVREYMR